MVVRCEVAEAETETQTQYNRWWSPGNTQFFAEVEAAFPDQGIANVEEARVLISELGYTYVDVRPDLELDTVGKLKFAVNIPLMNAKRVWSAEEGKKVVIKEDNPDFVKQVEKRFPDKASKLLIACSDGKSYSIDALIALEEAGYENMAALRGGFYAFYRVFDNNLRRRRGDGYTETYTHDGDSCGIHSSGAGFDRVDSADRWVPPTF